MQSHDDRGVRTLIILGFLNFNLYDPVSKHKSTLSMQKPISDLTLRLPFNSCSPDRKGYITIFGRSQHNLHIIYLNLQVGLAFPVNEVAVYKTLWQTVVMYSNKYTLRRNSWLHCISSSQRPFSCFCTAGLMLEMMIYSGVSCFFWECRCSVCCWNGINLVVPSRQNNKSWIYPIRLRWC